MDKHKPSEEMIKDLELVEGQMHSINEFGHLKKALDLLTLQLFDVQNKVK
jgi:hypothetical protein